MSTKKRNVNKKFAQLKIAIDAIATYCRTQSTSVTEFHRLGGPLDQSTEAGENLAKIHIELDISVLEMATEMLLEFELEFGAVTQFETFAAKVRIGKEKRVELKVTIDSQEEINNDFDTFIRNLLNLGGVQNV